MECYPSMRRASCALSLVLLLFSVIGTTTSQSIVYQCDNQESLYYSQNATFSNVYINASLNYGFQCHYDNYKTTIKLVDSSLDEVPKKLFDTYTALINATLASCGIKQINRYSLERASMLQVLDLSGNELEEVKSFAFAGAAALILLNLASNNISTIAPTAFHVLPALRILYLQGNRLRLLDGALFSQLVALKHLFLADNELELLEGTLFERNTLLENVLLQNNRLSVIDEATFGGANLKLVSLKNNRLTKLDLRGAHAKKILLANNGLEEVYISASIRELYAEHNRIVRIATADPSTMTLETLMLSNNSITSLEPITALQSLKSLDLAFNELGPLRIDCFANLSKLQMLRLERTGVSNLQHGTFAQQDQLQWLDLSYNNLGRVDLDILTSLTRLTTLYIDGNRLTAFDYGQLKKMFPALAELGLTDNRWNCTFLAGVVRYCTEHAIELVIGATADPVRNQTNVKGIYCYDEKSPLADWNATVQHLLAGNNSESGALQSMLQSVLDDVRRYGDGHTEASDRTAKLEEAVTGLTRRQLALDNGLLELRKSLLDLRLTLLSNRTNETLAGSDELRRMISSVNNLTLDRQQLSADQLELKLNKQVYRVDQALETAKANADKLTVLGQRVEQWLSSVAAPGGAGFFAADKQQYQQQQQRQESSSGGTSTGLLVAVLVMVSLLAGVIVFALFRSSRRQYTVDRRRYANRDSSLTTIVDNDI